MLEDFTYQRRDNIIRYPRAFELCEQYNYVMYKNPDFKDKYYYAYITDMKFVNPNMTEITIKTDVFQTWQFDFIYKKSFVEREHVQDDTIGKHTIPEGLETGEYITNDYEYESRLESYAVMVTATKPVDDNTPPLQPNLNQRVVFINGNPYYRLDLCM